MENWCYDRPTLYGFAKHYETGEPLPEEFYQRLLAARTYRQACAHRTTHLRRPTVIVPCRAWVRPVGQAGTAASAPLRALLPACLPPSLLPLDPARSPSPSPPPPGPAP